MTVADLVTGVLGHDLPIGLERLRREPRRPRGPARHHRREVARRGAPTGHRAG